jgi:hypothetical protein
MCERPLPGPGLAALLVVVATGAVTAAGFAWFCARGAAARYLPDDPPAAWVVCPDPPDVAARDAVERRAVFTRTFALGRPPAAARLRARALGRCAAEVNGVAVPLPQNPAGNWKRPAEADVTPHLRAGENALAVTVSNAAGPPALWLDLEAGGTRVVTDDAWDVRCGDDPPRPARLASAPLELPPGGPVSEAEESVASLRARLPTLLLFAALSAGAVAVVARRRRRAAGRWPRRWLAPLGVAALWLLLAANNFRWLGAPAGFDGQGHRDYVTYLQDHHSLPDARDGWEMHQPPLFYLAAAGLLGAGGQRAAGDVGLAMLQVLSLAAAVAQLLLVAGCLRLVYPDRPGARAAGLLVAGFLPVHLYLAHYLTNDMAAAALATAAVYLCLTVLRQERPSATRLACLGLCLGAAVLTKLSALSAVPAVLGVLAGRLVARRCWGAGAWLREVALPAAACAAVCGWFFVRNWLRFGTPLVGCYDPAARFDWWQDPGYATGPYLVRFGRSLAAPFFSVVHGFPDGLYSTLWGDGLWGGAAARAYRPPWNYDLMAAGYLLALLPTLAAVVGAAAALVDLVRRPRAEGFLLLGLPFFAGAALLYHFLRYPYFCHVKAFYALPAVVSLCVFAARGVEVLSGGRPAVRAALVAALGAWALTAYASFWAVG